MIIQLIQSFRSFIMSQLILHVVCSFKSSYPSWEPNAQGKQFLVKVGTFREQKLQRPGIRHTYNHYHPPLFRGSPLRPYNLDQRNHYPYLLDWYYTSRARHSANNTEDLRNLSSPDFAPNDARHDDDEEYWFDDRPECTSRLPHLHHTFRRV